MAADSLRRLLNPRSIAFVGGRRAQLAMEQCDRLGYDGALWPVNPHLSTMAGRGTFATLDDLPGVPDAVFVAVAAEVAVEVVGRAAGLGAGGAVVYASGFAESGPGGAAREAELRAAAGRMPVIGPNCHGFVNAMTGAALWPDVHGCSRVDRGIAIISQSGNLAIDITMQQRGLPLALAMTVGNQAVISIADCVSELARDDRITCIGLHVEGIGDSLAFAEAVTSAHRAGKPVVALKTGATGTGAAIAATHTASLAGPTAANAALFTRYGVAQVASAGELLAALSIVHQHGPPGGNSVVSLSCSGGEASLMADLGARYGVTFRPFAAGARARLHRALQGRVAISNPLDYHTFIWGDRAKLFEVFRSALEGGADAGILVIDFPAPGLDQSDWWPTVDAFADASRHTGVAGIVTSTLAENLPAAVCHALAGRGLIPIPSVTDCLAALAALAAAGRLGRPERRRHYPPVSVSGRVRVDEAAAKARLEQAGLPVPDGRRTNPSDAPAVAAALGYPVVMKALAPAHRSEHGGVILGVDNEEAAVAAAQRLAALGPDLIVEQQVAGAVGELLVGIRHEVPVGWALTLGAGGVLAELLNDTVTELLPVTEAEITEALGRLQVGTLLNGYRGGPQAHLAAAIDAIHRLTQFALANRCEIEVNPLILTDRGAWIVDALMEELI